MGSTFITYEQALDILGSYAEAFPEQSLELGSCLGAYLAEDLVADRDFPPFDRVTMDGIAISFRAFSEGRREFPIESVAPAGTPQQTLKDPGQCIEVMTGAIMPRDADTVIRYEDLEMEGGKATLLTEAIQHRQNVHFKGMDIPEGRVIVPRGTRISPAEINIAAAVGKDSLKVKRLPRTVIISTGDELVDIGQTPELHQIRRSNVYGIRSTLKQWGLDATLSHLPDDKPEMERIIAELLQEFDLLVFTGGVSKGKFDYLPEVLEALKVEKHFHKVQQRPGKPFWFGTSREGKKIFALPGNPVSSFVCTYIYLDYWLRKSLGIDMAPLYVELKQDVQFAPDLVYFLEARLESRGDGTLLADPVKGNGSGDFANLVRTDGFLVLPQNKKEFRAGEAYPFVSYRTHF